jgi:cation diffusion facilitator family transporter
VSPQRRTALVSVLAAIALVAIKLVTGLATDSLGLVSEAVHSGTDLVAALLTFFAIGVAIRPADRAHQFGHGKAEHLAALAEAAILVLASLYVSVHALERLFGSSETKVDPTWWAFAVVGVVIVVDVSRTLVSLRAARAYHSEALRANALHFGSDVVGSLAVLVGLIAARAGYPDGDSLAALFVAALVLTAAYRLMRRNVDVLMDRAPIGAEDVAREAIAAIAQPIQLRRLRMRHAAGRTFADVVIGVPPAAAVGQGHAAADAVEDAIRRALPESDVVVHVEPLEGEAALRERALAAALGVPNVREIHNLAVVDMDSGSELSLHLKLPGDLSLEEAHEVAEQVERAIVEAVPEISSVQTHLEPLAEPAAGREAEVDTSAIERCVRELTGEPPRELRVLTTDEGLVAFVTLRLDSRTPLAEAHARASEVEERIRRATPGIADVIVHTEP